MHQKISIFDQERKNVSLKSYWLLGGLNFEQTLKMFIKTNNLIPLLSKIFNCQLLNRPLVQNYLVSQFILSLIRVVYFFN